MEQLAILGGIPIRKHKLNYGKQTIDELDKRFERKWHEGEN